MDVLLLKLRQAGFGIQVGNTFADVFGYADDLALISPSLHALNKMISICEMYVQHFCIIFYPTKSKLICYAIDYGAPIIKLYNIEVEVVTHDKHAPICILFSCKYCTMSY